MSGGHDQRVLIQVFGTSMPQGGCGCGAGLGSCCGPDDDAAVTTASQEEQAAELGERLVRYFGDRVVVEYVDVFSQAMARHRAALEVLVSENVPLPLISVNGEPRFAGGISLEMISDDLEAQGLVAPVSTHLYG